MPIGAVLGGASIVGSFIGSSSNKKAANKAAQQSQQATDQSLALQRESRDMALQRLDPYNNRGNLAGNQINALLGLGGARPTAPATAVQPNALSQFSAAQRYGLGDSPMYATNTLATGGAAGGTATPSVTPQQAAQNAFDQFRQSTNYQFRLGEGLDAVNSGYAGSGVLQSGAALRGINDYAQNMASSELGNYLALLSQQQGVGAGAASAAAGVGQNFANNAANLIVNNGNNQANAAIYRAQNNPFANALGAGVGVLSGLGGFG